MGNFTHGSLFSGIGGFDLAAEWMGWENKFHCEWNPFGQKVLKYYWPNAESFNDITKTNFTKYANKIDILTGGFPCQPYSNAGKRLGKADERHLWPEMLRAIREIKPTYIVGENVRGLLNWNGGMVFDEVCTELENIGYQVAPCIIPACAVGAPHRRERIWFIAYAELRSNRLQTKRGLDMGGELLEGRKRQEKTNGFNNIGKNEFATNTNSDGQHERDRINEVNTNKGGFNAQRNIEQGIVDGDIANTECAGLEHRNKAGNIRGAQTEAFGERREFTNEFAANGDGERNVTNATSHGRGKNNGFGKPGLINEKSEANKWQNFPTVSPICDGNDGISDRLDGITFSKWRNESIKAGGNAIVPQVAYQIFKAIEKLHV